VTLARQTQETSSLAVRSRVSTLLKKGLDWKYIPIRRTAVFLRESLDRRTQWVFLERTFRKMPT
jgi:hypothetical protein